MRFVYCSLFVLVVVPVCVAQQAASRLTAVDLEAKAIKCRTAKQALKLYEESTPTMSAPEREKSEARQKYWMEQAEKNAHRVGDKWISGEEFKALAAEADPLARKAWETLDQDRAGAIDLADKALAIYPEHVTALFVKGCACAKEKDYSGAKNWFGKCVDATPESLVPRLNLAVCLEIQSDFWGAFQQFEECANIDCKNPALADSFARFIADMDRDSHATNRKYKRVRTGMEALAKTTNRIPPSSNKGAKSTGEPQLIYDISTLPTD